MMKGYRIDSFMTKFIVGTKAGMSQMYTEDGTLTAVTLIKVVPNVVTQVKTKEKDGYEAVQVGTGSSRKLSKGQKGHLKDLGSFPHLKEFRYTKAGDKELAVGDSLDASLFEVGDKVKVSGLIKGKGFAGVVKRHGFRGASASHGHKKVLRSGGSIGGRFPQHVLKGLRMAGRDGGTRTTIRNLVVVAVDAKEGLVALRGAVPGPRNKLLEIVTI
jgi:large subunit ribosomal protein L3